MDAELNPSNDKGGKDRETETHRVTERQIKTETEIESCHGDMILDSQVS